MKKELEEVYKEKTGLIMVVIDGFKRGSTVVEFRVIFQSNAAVTEDEVVKTINDAVIDGKLGGLTIKEGSIQVGKNTTRASSMFDCPITSTVNRRYLSLCPCYNC